MAWHPSTIDGRRERRQDAWGYIALWWFGKYNIQADGDLSRSFASRSLPLSPEHLILRIVCTFDTTEDLIIAHDRPIRSPPRLSSSSTSINDIKMAELSAKGFSEEQKEILGKIAFSHDKLYHLSPYLMGMWLDALFLGILLALFVRWLVNVSGSDKKWVKGIVVSTRSAQRQVAARPPMAEK